ncbi:NADP-dependent oxidoreductase [Zhongshania aquimaris]|uniref:NADP-dependent oxidoreductase n=1 Tax=Zhongshania aquimaris TaxID=2857107 RepID=A0ABS6VVR1_9GAMM|nr:NADP-dependent oxidoreductase [Zhongshania aquimaris]MBW2942425.1 NADP-dependent oxidoreductase [Zhongshania aquimaris]
MKNTQWILRSRPEGEVEEENFTLQEKDIPSISEGEFLVEVKYLSVDPSQRGWLNDVPSYVPPVAIGEVMRATGVGYVVESKHPSFSAGDVVEGGVGWQTYATCNGSELFPVRKVTSSYPLSYSLHVLGLTGLTAFFGMLRVAQVKAGDVVVVSGAGGATGSIAGQLAKLRGARVIGIAGGAEKCKWLVDDLGFSAAIDYKNESVADGLARLCKNSIDVFFDNVGGPILDDVLVNLKVGGRITLCGGISSGYGKVDLPPGPQNYMQLVIRRAVMQGFLVLDFAEEFPAALEEIGALIDNGNLKVQESCMEGIASCPLALKGLFRGENIGKQLVKV